MHASGASVAHPGVPGNKQGYVSTESLCRWVHMSSLKNPGQTTGYHCREAAIGAYTACHLYVCVPRAVDWTQINARVLGF